MRIKSVVLSAVALTFCLAGWASAQTLKTDAEIEAMGYTHIYSLSIPNTPNFKQGAPYSLDNSNLDLGPIESVAYRLNLGEDNFCYASFGAYTSDLTKIGVPTFTSQVVAQQYVYNLYYEAKTPNNTLTTTGTTVTKGNIEFWPWNYTTANPKNIPGASGNNGTRNYDFGDSCSYGGTHGSMQIHDYQNKTTVFAINRFNDGQAASLGIGNCANTSFGLDWTTNYNSASYSTKQLDVFAKPVFSEMISQYGDQYNNIKGEVSGMKLVYKLDCPLQGQYSADNYTVNNATNSDIVGMPLSRVGYYMVMEKADGSIDYAYASFDAVTNDLNKVGLPLGNSNWSYQQTVNNLTVQSNIQGVVNGSGIQTGNIEIWNTDYTQTNAIEELGASSSDNNSGYDFGDTRKDNGSYGCFQIHNYGAGQTVMALNKWNGQANNGKTIDMGIGNNPVSGGAPDYTFDGDQGVNSNASQYKSRSLYVLAQPAIAPGMSKVADSSKYALVQGARLTSQMSTAWTTEIGGVDYDIVDNVAQLQSSLGPFDRVGYYMEYAKNVDDPLQYVFVSFDAMTGDISKIGVPTASSGEFYQQKVYNLQVTTNVSSSEGRIYDPSYLQTGKPAQQATADVTYSHNEGYLEFWASNYGTGKSDVISQGDGSKYDLNDSGGSTGYGHGSMQIHSLDTEQTIFALNDFKSVKQFGIGTNPSTTGHPDWTGDESKKNYAIANIYTFAKPVLSDMETEHFNVIRNEAPGMHLVYKLDCPLYDQDGYSASNYTVNNIGRIGGDDLNGMPLRVAYYMTLEKSDGSMDYAYASFNSLTNNIEKIGLPFNGSWSYQQNVYNMTVLSNVDGVNNGTKITGNVNINRSGEGDYSCFQISGAGDNTQTVMALNAWNGEASSADRTIDIGIGNNTQPGGSPNYVNNGELGTASNASQYTNRTLYVMAGAAIAPGMAYVPDASDYTIVQGARLTTQMSTGWSVDNGGVNYDIVNNVAELQKTMGPFDRVGYYMEYAATINDPLTYAFVSFDAMTADVSKIGVPTVSSGELYKKKVYNLQVTTNVSDSEGLITDPDTHTQIVANNTVSYKNGYLEFWPSNYKKDKSNVITQGSGSSYDINDDTNDNAGGTSYGHGSMQIHSLDTEQTIFALNRFNGGKQFGIGKNATGSGDPDWTNNNAKQGYTIANIYTFVKPVLSAMDAEHFQTIKEEAPNMHLVYKLDCPLYSDKYNANNYTVNNLDNLGDLAGMPLKRVAYYMTLEKSDGSVDYAYASYDSLTNDPAKIGLPLNGEVFQTEVNNLTVSSNVTGVVNGTGLNGNVEIWNRNYTMDNKPKVDGASDSLYDFGDKIADGGNYACFQIHNYGDKQTVMALNAWNGVGKSASRTIDIGIGNNPVEGGHPDYTTDGERGTNSNASQYVNRTLYVMAERAIAPCMENVDNASDYTLVQGARLTTQMTTSWQNGINYDIVNNVASLQEQGVLFDRVGYYMEYAQNANDPLTYVFVSFDAMTTDISKIGVPTYNTGVFYQQVVKNLEVTTNVNTSQGLLNDPVTKDQAKADATIFHDRGYIEFWPSNYGAQKTNVIAQGSDNIYDINDSGSNLTSGHGSMQIHSLDTGQTIFALNAFKENYKSYGIGSNPNPSSNNQNSQSDWTFDKSRTGYKIANIYTFVHTVDALLTTSEYSLFQRDLNNTADVTLSGTWAASKGITINLVQASVDGGDWFDLSMNADGTFTSDSISLVGGMHSVSYQALDASGTILATQSGQVGVGEIFITAGQGNATNLGDVAQCSTSSMALAYNPQTGQWQLNEDPQQGTLDGSGRGSTWPSFADKLSELEGVPVGTYSVGYGESSLSQWVNDANGIYSNLKEAMEFLNENADGFAGILWHQGESGAGDSSQTYEEMLEALIARTRADSGNENLPWGVAIASADANGNVNTTITDDQGKVIAEDPLVFEGVNTDKYPANLRGSGNNAMHLNAAGLKQAGIDWATSAGESIIGLRKYWLANSDEALAVSDWEINGGYKLGIKLVSGDNLSVTVPQNVQMLADGTVEVGEGYSLTLTGDVSGSGALEKTGKGTLTLFGDASAFTGKTTVSDGSLNLTAGGTLYNLSGGSEAKPDDPESEYNPVKLVSAGDLTFRSDSDTKFVGMIDASGKTITKTGSGTLKIFSGDEDNPSTSGSFIVNAGRLDFKGYYTGSLEINAGAVLSPGNSIGTLTIDGTDLPSAVSALVLHTASTLLMEIAEPNPDNNDMLIVDGNLDIEEGAIIKVVLYPSDYSFAPNETFYAVIQADGTSRDIILSALTSPHFIDLDVLHEDGTNVYTITGKVDPNVVPEPSTWALLILGAAGLMFWRKRK